MAIASTTPTLDRAIGVVLGLRPEEEMSRVAARRVVAGMANEHPIGDRAMSEFPCDAMRPAIVAVVPGDAITGIHSRARPRPAFIGSMHFDLRTHPLND
jgi:hypothetical protein